MPINKILDMSNINLTDNFKFKVLNGQIIDVDLPDGVYVLNDENDVVALIKISKFKAKMSLFLG